MSLFSKSPQPGPVLDLRTSPKRPRRSKSVRPSAKVVIIVLLAVIAIAVVVAVSFYVLNRPSATPKTAMSNAVTAVGRLMILPAGEEPTYGTVADKSKLSSQTFFKNAQNGDEVLIYAKAKLTILYRPSINKIVNVGPVVSGKTGSPYITSRIAIENGSGNEALLAKMTAAVTAAFPNATIAATTTASRTYPTSLAIDISEKNQPLAEQVADTLGLQGGKLPLGESAPAADLLILIGQDYR
jgi:hypothetical protein